MIHITNLSDLFDELKTQETAGNINGVILKAAAAWDQIQPVRSLLLKRIAYYLEHYPAFITPASVKALKKLPQNLLSHFKIKNFIDSYQPLDPADSFSLYFPAVTLKGLVRRIEIQNTSFQHLSSARRQLLEQTGAAMFAVLRQKSNLPLLWYPANYSFSLLDIDENEDQSVEGLSMGLALSLVLYAHITKTPLPIDISATAEVRRNGDLYPVHGIEEKIKIIQQERPFIKKIFISDLQQVDIAVTGIELVRVKTLSEALDIICPSKIDPAILSAPVEIETALENIHKQYWQYLIDTCIENAKILAGYITSKNCPHPKKRKLPVLFACYWRLGSCYCHKGKVQKSFQLLKKAEALYNKNKGLINFKDFLNSRINFAVTLKDIFRYKEAKALHLKVLEEIERIGSGLDYENGKNLSSLSQLYLAECNFAEAEKYQRQALKFIPGDEIHRNLNYLAQILFRSGRFRSARTCLDKSKELIERTEKYRQKNLIFFNWFLSEYLYRKGASLKQRPQKIKNFNDLHLLASKYPDINGYVPALIHKFSAIALLEQGNRQEGMDRLDLVIQHFNAQNSPIFRLLGVSASVEKALYLLKYSELPEAAKSLKDIRKNLKLQKDIHHYFSKEIKEISKYLRFKNPGEDRIKAVCSALEALGRKIPY